MLFGLTASFHKVELKGVDSDLVAVKGIVLDVDTEGMIDFVLSAFIFDAKAESKVALAADIFASSNPNEEAKIKVSVRCVIISLPQSMTDFSLTWL